MLVILTSFEKMWEEEHGLESQAVECVGLIAGKLP